MMKKYLALVLLGAFSTTVCFADAMQAPYKQRFFYVGVTGGYGNNDWSSMVARDGATAASGNPTAVSGEGPLFGGDFGYQINRHLAVEAEYVQMPKTDITMSFLDVLPYQLTSKSSFASITLKIMAPILNSNFTFFVDAGPAYQWRKDSGKWSVLPPVEGTQPVDIGTWAPIFGGGFLYRMANNWQAEASFQYLPGTGKSVISAMSYYIPEVYAGTFRLDYIF